MRTPIAERVHILETSPDVKEIARYGVAELTLRVYLSLEKHVLDDTHSKVPLPPYVELPVLRLTIGRDKSIPSMTHTEPTRIVLRVSGKGQRDIIEEIAVHPMRPGEFIGRVFGTGFGTLEVIDWWLERLPEQRSIT